MEPVVACDSAGDRYRPACPGHGLPTCEQSIASAREQRATFETVGFAYQEKHPAADITPLTTELRSLDREIDRMIVLSNELSSMQS